MALNTFQTSLVKGHLEQTNSTVLRSTMIDSGAADFGAGTAVKLGTYNDAVVITPITAATDAVYGIVPYSSKKDTWVADEEARVVIANAVVIMEASAAIAVGADVEMVPTGMKIATATTGTVVGVALEAAAADGDLIRVELKIA